MCVSDSAPRPRRRRRSSRGPGRRPGAERGWAPRRGARVPSGPGARRRGIPSGLLGRRLDVPSGEPRRSARARRGRPGRWPGPRTRRPPGDADAEPARPRSKPPVLSLCPLGIRRPGAVRGNLNCWNPRQRTPSSSSSSCGFLPFFFFFFLGGGEEGGHSDLDLPFLAPPSPPVRGATVIALAVGGRGAARALAMFSDEDFWIAL